MTLKEMVMQAVRSADRRTMEQDAAHRAKLANTTYHSYFEGYTEYLTVQGNRKRIARVYTGKWYRQQLGAAAYILLRALYTALCALAVSLFFRACTADVPFNRVWYTTVFEALAVPLLFYLLVMLVNYVFADRRMDIHTCKLCRRHLPMAARLAALAECAAALGMLVHLFRTSGFSAGTIQPAIELVISASSLFALDFAERRVAYETLDNDTPPPEGGTEIGSVSQRRK